MTMIRDLLRALSLFSRALSLSFSSPSPFPPSIQPSDNEKISKGNTERYIALLIEKIQLFFCVIKDLIKTTQSTKNIS